jgi:hypothetical protein
MQGRVRFFTPKKWGLIDYSLNDEVRTIFFHISEIQLAEDGFQYEPVTGCLVEFLIGYTPDQTERSHSDVDSDSKAGGRKPREVKESSAAERHMQGEPGFVEAGRRSAAVQDRRRETQKVFADRRKKSSANR